MPVQQQDSAVDFLELVEELSGSADVQLAVSLVHRALLLHLSDPKLRLSPVVHHAASACLSLPQVWFRTHVGLVCPEGILSCPAASRSRCSTCVSWP